MANSDFQQLTHMLMRMSQEQESNMSVDSEDMMDYWYDLSDRERQRAFYCVVSMINEARLNNDSVRETLYEQFEFNPGMYAIAEDAGFMELWESYQKQDRETKYVNRVEVIDESGRAYVNMSVANCTLGIQDNGQTLKVFVSTDDKSEEF